MVASLTDDKRAAWLGLWSDEDTAKHEWVGPVGTPAVVGWDGTCPYTWIHALIQRYFKNYFKKYMLLYIYACFYI